MYNMPEKDIFEEDSDIEIQADIPQSVTIAEYAGEVEVGEVTTLPAGSDATVTNRGTATKAILDFGLPKGESGADWGEIGGDLSDQTDLANALNGLQSGIDSKAAKNNAILTGTPVAPTAIDSTNTTQIATTEFVQNAIALLRNEINQAVANVLKRMDFSNAVNVTLKRGTGNYTYTVPADGYIVFQYSNVSAVSNALLINGKNIFGYESGSGNLSTKKWNIPVSGTIFPVSSGDVIAHDSNPGDSAYTYLTFVPQVS
jgi:hypothetical protein